MQDQESDEKKILFLKDRLKPKRSEKDIMLALNKILQKAGKLPSIRVYKIRYF